ncbi:unnamed protein product [Durusdinium trenchii]|uniref:Uncharacterized protein n=1 Tax=Durusdinium trenchii TaxID=1381693 RepID=A0ABP0I8J9_9DINO
MLCGDEGDDFVCGYPMYTDSKTAEPYVLELYRAHGAAAKDLISNRLRHNALTILRHMVRKKAKPDMMHYPLPIQAEAEEARKRRAEVEAKAAAEACKRMARPWPSGDWKSLLEHFKKELLVSERFIIYKIEGDKVVVEKEGDKDKKYSDFMDALKEVAENEPRYAVVDFHFETADGRPQDKLVFIGWSPDTSGVKPKMTYASTKDAILKKLSGVHKALQITESSDLTFDEIVIFQFRMAVATIVKLLRRNLGGPMSNNDLKTTTETTETASAETQTAGEFSQGSRGHPEFCKRPCVHFFTRGCAAGAGCNYCHAEHPKRPTSLDKSQRRLLVKVEEQHLLEIVMGHLRARAEHFGFGSPCEELFQILETRWKGLDPDVPASWSPSEQQNMRRVLGKMTFAGLLGLVLSRSSTEDGGTLFAQDVNHALERLREVMPTINQH